MVKEGKGQKMIPLKDLIKPRRTPFINWMIIGANVLVFLYQLTLPPYALNQVFHLWGVVPARYFRPGWASSVGYPKMTFLPFITSMFLHGGWLHLISNMWALWIFGDNVEDRLGHIGYLVFYILCGVLAAVLHMVLHLSSPMPTIGASGAIAGVMGAYMMLYPGAQILVMMPILFYPIFFPLPAVLYLIFWFVSQFLSGTLSLLTGAGRLGGIAFWAHIGGFVAGVYFIRKFVRKPRQEISYR